MSFLKVTGILGVLSAAVLVPLAFASAKKFFSDKPFTDKELEVMNSKNDLYLTDNFVYSTKMASYIVADAQIKGSQDKRWVCMISALVKDIGTTPTQEKLKDTEFEGSKWLAAFKQKLTGGDKLENKKRLVETCSRNRWMVKDSTQKHEISAVFVDLEKKEDNRWVLDEKNVESLFTGTYDSSDWIYEQQSSSEIQSNVSQ